MPQRNKNNTNRTNQINKEMKAICRIKKRIEYLIFPRRKLGSKYQRTNRRVATQIKAILENNGVSVEAIHFTDFAVRDTKQKMVVTCTMMRPGVFIGRAGQTFDLVESCLADFYGKTIEIKIKEKILWN